MFGRPRAGWALRRQVLPDEHAFDGPVTLTDACTDLLATLAELSKYQAVLDGDVPPSAEGAIAVALDAVWDARRTCDELAAAILRSPPRTAIEASVRLEAVQAYLALPDVDELMLSRLIDANPLLIEGSPSTPSRSSPLWLASNWRAWLRIGCSSGSAGSSHNRPTTDHSCPQP